MAVAQRMSEQAYERFVLSGVEGDWELHDGRLVEKPAMSVEHGRVVSRLSRQLLAQLGEAEYAVRINEVRVRKPVDTIVMPDLLVVPTAEAEPFVGRRRLTMLARPLPLVVEVWSPSTGGYDVDAKIPIYQQRGDLEIWRIHPSERTLTSWVRQSDGTYAETIHQSGMILPVALPGPPIGRGRHFDA